MSHDYSPVCHGMAQQCKLCGHLLTFYAVLAKLPQPPCVTMPIHMGCTVEFAPVSITVPATKVCTCGSASVNSPRHAHYCDLLLI